jgi:hypothetical protein
MAWYRAATLTIALVAGVSCSGLGAGDDLGTADRLDVYAAVIAHMTAEEGQPSGYPVIYVADRIDPSAADPEADHRPSTPISEEMQAALVDALADVGTVDFISQPNEVIGPQAQGGRVEGGGILITLGPIRPQDDRLEVPASSYLANLAATWQTWVVERRGGSWTVTGTTGPVAIS